MEDRLKQPLDEDRRVTGLKGWIRVHVEMDFDPVPDMVMINLAHVQSVQKMRNGALISSLAGQLLTEETFEEVVILMELAS